MVRHASFFVELFSRLVFFLAAVADSKAYLLYKLSKPDWKSRDLNYTFLAFLFYQPLKNKLIFKFFYCIFRVVLFQATAIILNFIIH